MVDGAAARLLAGSGSRALEGSDRSSAGQGRTVCLRVARRPRALVARRRGGGGPHTSRVAPADRGPGDRSAGSRCHQGRSRGHLPGEPVLRLATHRGSDRHAAAGTARTGSGDGPAAQLGEPAGTGVDGQRSRTPGAIAQGGRLARAAGGLLADGRRWSLGVRALEGHSGRRPAASHRLVELEQPIAGLRQRMRYRDRSRTLRWRTARRWSARSSSPETVWWPSIWESPSRPSAMKSSAGNVPVRHRRATQYRSFAAQADRHDGDGRRKSAGGKRSHGS